MSLKEKKELEMTCPQCQKKIIYDAKNKYRPFCSKPCYDLDLIKWHDEDYGIKGEQASFEEIVEEERKKKKNF